MRVALAALVALIAVGCGSAREKPAGAPDADDPGVIVFTGLSGGGGGYFSMRPDGTAVSRIAFGDEEVTLSADGRFIASVARSSGRVWADRVFVSRVDGSERRQVSVPDEATIVAEVSPDGNRLAVVYMPDSFEGPWDVWTVSVSGDDFEQRTSSGEVQDVAWSPDGEHLAFMNEPLYEDGSYDGNGNIYVMRADGSDARRVARGGEPAWSPDGKRIAFTDADWNVSWVDRSGGEAVPIAPDGRYPKWSPDGKRVAFLRNVACGHATCVQGIFIVSADGGKPRRVGPTLFESTLLGWTTVELPSAEK